MKVILTSDVRPLGKAGAVVSVKDGYARNYLFPRGMATVADASGLKALESLIKQRQVNQARERQAALELAKRLSAVSCTISVEAKDDDQLYGSVGPSEIVTALETEGIVLEKSQIRLADPIKRLGVYQVPVKLESDVLTELKVWVVRS